MLVSSSEKAPRPVKKKRNKEKYLRAGSDCAPGQLACLCVSVCVCVCLCVSVSVASPDFAPRLKKRVVVAVCSKYTRALVFENLCFF